MALSPSEMEDVLNAAGDKLRRMASVNPPYGARVNAEQQYGLAYQALVRAGLRRQIRAKYRGGR